MSNKNFFLICFACVFLSGAVCGDLNIDKIVIWGHKLHTHTHSYVHNGFYIAFSHLGYPTYWYDNGDDVSDIDFSRTLFLTEGQVDQNIPLRDDCYYVLHNCDGSKYSSLPKNNCLKLQVYVDSVLVKPNLVKLGPCVYYDLSQPIVYMPWATDLLPDEIEKIKGTIEVAVNSKSIFWIGSIGEGVFGNILQLQPFINACEENGIAFQHAINLSREDNIRLIQSSYMAPTIVGQWQFEKGYIPCRIFKNISYGKMGITNSKRVFELFEEKIVYNPDTYQLFYDAQKRMQNFSKEDLYEQMDLVRDKHTYLNRITVLLEVLEELQKR